MDGILGRHVPSIVRHANPGWGSGMPCVSSCVKFGIRRVRDLENCSFSPSTRDSTRSVVSVDGMVGLIFVNSSSRCGRLGVGGGKSTPTKPIAADEICPWSYRGSGQSPGLLAPIPAAKALGLFSASTTCRRLPTPPSTKGRRPSRHDALRDQDMATRVRDAAREEHTKTAPLATAARRHQESPN